MKPDLYTKAVLTIIALALSTIALNPWIAPTPAKAQDWDHINIQSTIDNITSTVDSLNITEDSIESTVGSIESAVDIIISRVNNISHTVDSLKLTVDSIDGAYCLNSKIC